ncbi:MAG: CopG family transcriptional regulator [Candidatus Magasanikbacteria bacterium CG10_big_fil_rev_8_21_14_0_10_36_16]|uniref:CopG family transcriptional regulator n=1 Tax=Candidatus Magasanikbacteria bacterium CG10_big_fil_rev_8_21_14_0_10_36_16 TaxID=1974645 RepID=A0A2H0TZP4_9BACT|nr:MAG: CopG family transcriptional regulator [Candidatus Magasanikbacteria bacterium CG10_big_fil_rev_8_21_14_0_10_36_16]
MKKKNNKVIFSTTLILFSVLFVGYTVKKLFTDNVPVVEAKTITVYKSQTCGCCGVYITYLRNRGFDVNVETMDDMDAIKKKYDIPKDKQSCHTSIIDDYVVEGHVPLEAINKMLDKKPTINGIALPDMPAGSPGMPGNKQGLFTIYSLDETQNNPVFTKL